MSATSDRNREEMDPDTAEQEPPLSDTAAQPPAACTGHLLVVDDNEADRGMFRLELEKHGYRVTTAGRQQALQILRSAGFDLILLDVVLPDAYCFEVLSAIRSDPGLRNAPVIVTSAVDEMQSVIRCIEMGAEDFVTRPFDPVLLRARIQAVIRRRRAEEQTAQLADNFRLLLESTGEGIYGIDVGGRCTFLNQAATRMLGYERGQLLGREIHPIIHRVHPDGSPYPESECPILRAARAGVSCRLHDEVLLRMDGSAFPVEYSAHPIVQDGVVKGAVVTFVDITERRRSEEKLRQSARLESLGVLAGGIAHDFNNLLTGIMGNASLVLDALSPADPHHGMLEDVVKASERAADLTRQMLAFAGKGQFVVRPLDIARLISEISDLIHASIPKKVELRLRMERSLPPVEADAGQMQQLIMNLVINAGEAIGEGNSGTVLVETGACDLDAGRIHAMGFADIRPGRYVRLEVHDSGCGMDEATQARIFDPFFTTKFTGRGLGLAATLGIVRSHKGALRVRSSPGKGSTFSIVLPASAASLPQTHGTQPIESPRGTGTILVVDDEEVVRRTAQAALERHGYVVLLAEDGQRAVDLFRQRANQVSLILLDMTMPVMSGEEAFRFLRAIRPDVPIIVSSGYNEVEVIRRFTGRGVAAFIQKPYTSYNLAQKVKTAMRGRRLPHTGSDESAERA